MNESELTMYIVVNSDLKMTSGKVAAQAAHSAVKASHLTQHQSQEIWAKWFGGSYTKIILKASEYQMREMLKKYPDLTVCSVDEGRTEIRKNSMTTIAFIVCRRDARPIELASLELY